MLEGKSFLFGIMAGIILRWTDVIPLVAGVIIGVSIKKLPEIVNIVDLPANIQNYIKQIKSVNSDL